VITIRNANELAQRPYLQAVLLHESRDGLVINHQALLTELADYAPIAITWKLGAQRGDPFMHSSIFPGAAPRAVIVRRARQLHDSASSRDGDGLGPLTME
jgi:hypothetical protein